VKTFTLFIGDEQGLRDVDRQLNTGSFTKQSHTELDLDILERIRRGDPLPSRSDQNVRNALLKLRRQGLIENLGSRSHPTWITKQ
jgi:hypothetical protein